MQQAEVVGQQRSVLSRRSFVKAGVLGTAGLSLSQLLRAEDRARDLGQSPRKNSVIILWMRGGPSHIDMWDPKPDAPVEFRGEFGVTRSRVPGVLLSDMLPMTARMNHQWSIVRSLHHREAAHSAGDQICFTGYDAGRDPSINFRPSCGSVVSRQIGHLTPNMPPYVMIPRMVPGTNSAYLGVAHKPFETMADPADEGPFHLPNFNYQEGVTLDRVRDRREMLRGFDSVRREVDHNGVVAGLDRYQHQAWDILSSSAARRAFDLDSEPSHIRDRYGFMPAWEPGTPDRCGAPAWSQRILLARRLVESGVRLVTVGLGWWDTHILGFESLRQGFLPRWDQAYSALIEDLAQRGLLESTLVLAWGEFGRTPRVNRDAGRDHYPAVFSAALAGGPVQGGRVVGASDSTGAFPRSNPKRPQDVLALLYRHLGVDARVCYSDNSGRPHSILPFGDPIDELC
ncbi:MAG: DUF1501 domain-containing protein [Gemmataceae bacterium]|nr:DUF1501 domain-containing protein [Gemmataceae bacterium]